MTIFKKEKQAAPKSVSWFGKWLPETFSRKAVEAMKIIERAIFSDDSTENKDNDSDRKKVKQLEHQLRSLQDKVEHLLSANQPTSHSDIGHKAQLAIKDTTPTITIINSQSDIPPKLLPFTAHDLQGLQSKMRTKTANKPIKVDSAVIVNNAARSNGSADSVVLNQKSTTSEVAVPLVPKPLPFTANDLQGLKLKPKAKLTDTVSTHKQISHNPVIAVTKPTNTVSTTAIVPKVLPFSVNDLLGQKLKKTSEVAPKTPAGISNTLKDTSRAPNQSIATKLAAKRPALKAFSSTDLRMVKLSSRGGKDKTVVKSIHKTTSATPSNKPSKSHSLKSALKNAIKTKFFRAKGSPGDGAATESDSDNEWSQ